MAEKRAIKNKFDSKEEPIRKIWKSLSEKGWKIMEIRENGNPGKDGLLNKPIKKLLVGHDGTWTPLAIKFQEQEPRLLFRSLYEYYGHASAEELSDFDSCCGYLSMQNMHRHERIFYRNCHPDLKAYIPAYYGEIKMEDTYCILMEDISSCRYMNQISSPQNWGYREIRLALETLAFFHSIEICPEGEIEKQEEEIDLAAVSRFTTAFHESMYRFAGMERALKTEQAARQFLAHQTEYEKSLSQYRKRMIHNDFNIRNICINTSCFRLMVYDWEFVDWKNPLSDVVDFLISLSSESLINDLPEKRLSIYWNALNKYGFYVSLSDIREQFYINLLKFGATRMNMYFLCYSKKKDTYMERMYRNLGILLDAQHERKIRISDNSWI